MRKMLAIAATAGVVGSTVFVGTTSAAAADCRMQRLPQPDGTSRSSVNAGSPSGNWLVGYGDVKSESKPLIWHNGEVRQPKIDVPDAELTAISSTGLAVGTGFRNDGEYAVPVAHQNGKTWKLPTLDKQGDATVSAVSPNGRTAVGSETIYEDGDRVRTIPVRWSGKRLQQVQKLAGRGKAVSDIHRGTVVGSSGDRAYVWPREDKPRFLPQASEPSLAQAVRGNYAVGEESPSDDTTGSVMLWNLHQDTATKLPRAVNAAYDVNSSGAAAVSTREPAGGDAATFENGRLHTLPSLGGGGSATTISEDGVVAGTTHRPSGDARAVVWRGCTS